MRTLKNAIALVTGASRGLGPHIARALARAGAHVAITARTIGPLEAVADSLRALGVRTVAVPANLDSQAERVRLVARAEALLGPFDVLVNNAGIEGEGAFADLDTTDIADIVRLNVEAPMQLARLVLPGMVQRGRGHIVNIGSLAGRKAVPYDAVYGGTKAAIIEWTSALRIELRKSGVSASSVCPGYVTGEGMFSRFGVSAPRLVGSCTPAQVAGAVVSAILRDRAEVHVNSLPLRPFLALYALFPGITDWLLDLLGITALQRRKIEAARGR